MLLLLTGQGWHLRHCTAGVVWGWCVAGIAFLPYTLYVLAAAPFMGAVGVLLLCLLGTLTPLVLVDRHYYGQWTVRSRSSQCIKEVILHSCTCKLCCCSVQLLHECTPANYV